MENAPLHSHPETRRLFEERFGWGITECSLATWMSKNGLQSPATAARCPWTPEMNEYFKSIAVGHSEGETRKLFAERFGYVLTKGQIKNRRKTLGCPSGTKGGQFQKGNVPFNKGRTWEEIGISDETRQRMLTTCFKKGNMPHNGVDTPIGSERITKDGYVEVKVAERPTRSNNNWRMKHQLVWEEANGRPVPPNTKVIFADHDPRNLDPDNLVAVPKSLCCVMNSNHYEYWDRESLEVAIMRAKVASARVSARKRIRESE